MNILLILGVSFLQIVISAFWFSPPLFGKFWMTVTGFDKMTSAQQKEAGKSAGASYGIQAVLQVITQSVLYFFITNTSIPWVTLSLLIWLGFLFPVVVQSELWINGDNNLKIKKVAVVSGQLLLTTMIGGFIFGLFR
jgi:Protein of unknown function (DUF1761)